MDLLGWFFLQTIAGEAFYRVRDRLLAAEILVLMAQGLDNDMIDRRLTLRTGTTASLAGDILREPGISRELLRETAQAFRADQPNRLSWTIVPVSMRDRRDERIAGAEA